MRPLYIIPRQKQVFDWKTCKNVADFFAQYIGYDSINVHKIYLAGALHDIGKMAVGNEIKKNRISLRMMNFQK